MTGSIGHRRCCPANGNGAIAITASKAVVTGALLYVLLHTHTTVTCLLNTLGSALKSEESMKKIVASILLAVSLASMLGGCIIVPDGGYHHHHDYYERY